MMDENSRRKLGQREVRNMLRKKEKSQGVPKNSGGDATKKTLYELQIELQAAQERALRRISEAKGKAAEVDLSDLEDRHLNQVMNSSQKNRVRAERQYERIVKETELAKHEFQEAGRVYGEAVVERVTWLEEELFGDIRSLPLEVKLSLGEKNEEQLLQLLEQAHDSNDEPLADIVLFAAHTRDMPGVRLAYFQTCDDEDGTISMLYEELASMPAEEEIARLVTDPYWSGVADPAIALLPTLEDLANRKPTPPILTR
jgi:hypothetical protein